MCQNTSDIHSLIDDIIHKGEYKKDDIIAFVHELSHAILALHLGYKIKEINIIKNGNAIMKQDGIAKVDVLNDKKLLDDLNNPPNEKLDPKLFKSYSNAADKYCKIAMAGYVSENIFFNEKIFFGLNPSEKDKSNHNVIFVNTGDFLSIINIIGNIMNSKLDCTYNLNAIFRTVSNLMNSVNYYKILGKMLKRTFMEKKIDNELESEDLEYLCQLVKEYKL